GGVARRDRAPQKPGASATPRPTAAGRRGARRGSLARATAGSARSADAIPRRRRPRRAGRLLSPAVSRRADADAGRGVARRAALDARGLGTPTVGKAEALHLGEHGMTHWWHDRLVDDYFGGHLRVRGEDRMRARLGRCASCRARYRRHLIVEAAMPGGDARA